MAEAEENRGKRQLDSMQMNGYSRDLLNKFMNKDHGHGKFQEISNEGDDKIELDLGLSLNGIFGVDPAAKGLQRSSSITNFVFGTGSNSNNGGSSNNPLPRTCSLPVETEEESRKRKELQCLRRFEAKKKRMEKLQNVNNKVVVNDKVDYEENGHYCYVNSLVMSQGSMGSQGSGSSGLSDFGSQPLQGPGDVRKTSNHITVPGDITEANAGDITEANAGDITEASAATTVKSSEPEQKQVATQAETTSAKSPKVSGTTAGKEAKEMFPVATQAETTSAKLPSVSGSTTSKEAKEMFKNFMLNMPCVSTRGDGPNGRHIEGFLYRYRKGEEVRIVCVCHGNFLSPAEFVKHAGGCDVENPLRHIVVNPTPPLE